MNRAPPGRFGCGDCQRGRDLRATSSRQIVGGMPAEVAAPEVEVERIISYQMLQTFSDLPQAGCDISRWRDLRRTLRYTEPVPKGPSGRFGGAGASRKLADFGRRGPNSVVMSPWPPAFRAPPAPGAPAPPAGPGAVPAGPTTPIPRPPRVPGPPPPPTPAAP